MCLFLMYKHDYENGASLPDKNFIVPDQLVFQMIELANDFILWWLKQECDQCTW